jgi:hypothetical protein
MTDHADISETARLAYNAGISPVDYAERELENLLVTHTQIAQFCLRHRVAPAADLSAAALSRRILGLLLNAGWTLPGGIDIPEVTP